MRACSITVSRWHTSKGGSRNFVWGSTLPQKIFWMSDLKRWILIILFGIIFGIIYNLNQSVCGGGYQLIFATHESRSCTENVITTRLISQMTLSFVNRVESYCLRIIINTTPTEQLNSKTCDLDFFVLFRQPTVGLVDLRLQQTVLWPANLLTIEKSGSLTFSNMHV